MANILKTTLTVNGYSKNSPTKEIVVTLDGSITVGEINNFLPNNNSRYDKEVERIPSGSSAQLLSIDTMYACTFIAEGSADGTWKCIAKIPYITT